MKSVPILLALALAVASLALRAQTPTPTPETTGKSYDLTEIKRPLTSAPQYPSPVNFTDVSGQTKIGFRHMASQT
ncbi:MAG TPA: hypothetical protein PKM58_10090, partial [Pyrinomonadaceae bacterium]|nr:hypothetical protein [Pyrinomonadaceae bacterium]